MICRFRRVLALTFVILMLPSIAAGSTEGNLVVTGGGWGHSVGLSQYGAEGMAREDFDHVQILEHYYGGNLNPPAVRVQAVPGIADLKIGLAQSVPSATFIVVDAPTGQPDGPVQIFRSGGVVQDVFPGNQIVVTRSGSQCVITIPTDPTHVASPGSCDIDLYRLTADSRITTSARTINHGFVFVRLAPTGIHTGAYMDLELYLKGIAEIPNFWQVETQRAQVIAARSYAQATTNERRDNSSHWHNECACDLFATTRDQAYVGWDSEVARPKWQTAIVDTTGKVITARDASIPLKAYYSSSTFGRTEPIEAGFGGSARFYLKSVDDHWAVDPSVGNPFASWIDTTPLGVAAQALGFATLTGATPIATSPGGAISRIRFTGTNSGGSSMTLDYDTRDLRSSTRLGLRSMQVTSVALVFAGEQVVLHDPATGKWFLRNSSGQVSTFFYGDPGDLAFMGDWNCDGVDTPGLYRRSSGFAYLRNSNNTGVADTSFFFGIPGDIPIAGDFDGNGCDSVSIYRPSEAKFYIINQLGSEVEGVPVAEFEFFYGNPGDVPFVGDWNGDNIDTPGLRRPSDGFVYLRNSNTLGVADVAFFYGNSGDIPFAGDWDLDGSDSIGLLRPSNKTVYLRNALSTGVADISYAFGESRYRPAGAWTG